MRSNLKERRSAVLELGRHFDGWAPARDGEDLVVATIVATSGSTPRPAGTSMLVAAGGGILGPSRRC